jgi:hypothetical protein
MKRRCSIALAGVWLCAAVLATGAETAAEVDESPLPLVAQRAFPRLQFQRPLLLTHAGDGSNRVFVASQLGTVHVFKNDQNTARSAVFLDIRSRVVYKDAENEEGLRRARAGPPTWDKTSGRRST